MKRMIALCTTAALLLPMLAACGSAEEQNTETLAVDTAVSGTESAVQTETETRDPDLDDITDTFDFGGTSFTISLPNPEDLGVIYYDRDEMTGDTINDAIYTRNTEVEDRFHVVIETRTDGWSTTQGTELRSLIMAGDDAVDLVALAFMESGVAFIANGLALPWNDVPYINLEKPYWNRNIVDTLAVRGRYYLLNGDLNWTTMCETAVCFFNKQLAADLDVPNLYDMVDEGRWTFEKLYEYASAAPADLNGDGSFDERDRYGCIQNMIVGIYSYSIAANYHTVIAGEDGVEMNILTEKMQSIVEYVNRLCYTDHISYMDEFDRAADSRGVEIFFDDRALFLMATLEHGEYFRQFDAEFGIIPYPKYDEQQEKYAATSDQWGLACALPVTVSDPAFNGVITEALCSGSAIHIKDVYYDKVLTGRQVRDEESARMLDMIFDNLIYDFGLCYFTLPGNMVLREMVAQQNNNLASWYAANKTRLTRIYDRIYAYEPK